MHSDTILPGVDWISCSHWAMTGSLVWQGFIDEQQMLWPKTPAVLLEQEGTLYLPAPHSASEFIPVPVFTETHLCFCLCR